MNVGSTITGLGLIRRDGTSNRVGRELWASIGSFDEQALLGVVGRIRKPV